MTLHQSEKVELIDLRSRIKAEFPESVFNGQITAVDGLQNEELDEQRALYGALMGKSWSEIPPSFIDDYPDGVLLLTDAAYAAFLPAWLTRALDRDRAREFMVYMFSPREPSEILDRRIRGLTSKQQEVLRAFLTYSLDVEQSQSIKEYAKRAVAYASNLKNS